MKANIDSMQRDIDLLKKAVEEIRVAFEMDLELRPEYVEKIREMERKGSFNSFNSFKELKESIENA